MSAPPPTMSVTSDAPAPAALNARLVVRLLDLAKRARQATSLAELGFVLVNETHGLTPYRLAALSIDGAIGAVSGVAATDRNAPFTLWLRRLTAHVVAGAGDVAALSPEKVPPDLATEWTSWLPEHALWVPLPDGRSGVLFARDVAWTETDRVLLREWVAAWHQSWALKVAEERAPWQVWRRRTATRHAAPSSRRRWAVIAAAALGAVLCLPVRLTVLAPAELIPADAAIVRAPLEGVVAVVHVQPNQAVRRGDRLVSYDDAALRSRLEVAQQALLSAEVEHRQALQQALGDSRFKAQLSTLASRVEERRIERDLLAAQFQRTEVLSPRDGIVLLDDSSDWVGRPVAIGERILRVADPSRVEIEAWVPLSDAVPLSPRAALSVFLDSDPLAPVRGRVRFVAHDSMARPDGSYAYRLRADLSGPTDRRIGLKGTARIEGERVSLAYWVFRRPLAKARGFIGY